MSNGDEIELDDDEITALREDSNELTIEEIFSMTMLNKVNGTKVHVELRDSDGDLVSIPDIISELTSYVKDKLKDKEGNTFVDQIMPLMSQAVVSGLGRMMGTQATAFILCNDITRIATIDMMCIGFLLLKFVQQKDLKIHTYSEKIGSEEIETLQRKARASNMATMGGLMGMDSKEILKEMIKHGQVTKKDLAEMDWDIDEGEDNDGESN